MTWLIWEAPCFMFGMPVMAIAAAGFLHVSVQSHSAETLAPNVRKMKKAVTKISTSTKRKPTQMLAEPQNQAFMPPVGESDSGIVLSRSRSLPDSLCSLALVSCVLAEDAASVHVVHVWVTQATSVICVDSDTHVFADPT